MKQNSYPHDGIFNPYLTTIKDLLPLCLSRVIISFFGKSKISVLNLRPTGNMISDLIR